ncbi:MAG: arginine:pyruvate transaminase [Paracoccaceae bacterium]|jgi:arginine:pyruvate transaminase
MTNPSAQIRYILEGRGDGWEILARARELHAMGDPALNLCVGEHDEPTPPEIIGAMNASAVGGHTGYAGLMGIPPLRAAIAARVTERQGMPCDPSQVIVTGGGQGALFGAMNAVLDPGDVCVIIDPYYTPYPGTVRAAGGVPRVCRADASRGFQPDAATLEAACIGAKALLINTPNNPTGAIYGPETLAMIADICIRHDLWLITDEVYDGMAFGRTHLSPAALPGMAERTIVIGSMSKSFAMCGFRCGWAAGPAAIIRLMGDLALNVAYGLPGFIQDAAAFALGQGAAIEDRITGTFERRHALAMAALADAKAVKAGASEGAMYVMIDIRATGMTGREFAHELIERERIAVMPGESFGEAAAGHVRATLTLPDDQLVIALTRLAAFAEVQAPANAAAG